MIVAAVAALTGIGYLTFTSGVEDVYVAAVDLPAYHQITQMDLRVRPVQRHDVPDGAVRSRDSLLGRYTLTPVPAERPFQLAALGPRLRERSIVSPIVALPSTPETTLGGRLARGDLVDVVLSPNDQPGTGRRFSDVLVLDVVDGANAAVVVTVNRSAALTLATARGSSTITVIRTVPYAGP